MGSAVLSWRPKHGPSDQQGGSLVNSGSAIYNQTLTEGLSLGPWPAAEACLTGRTRVRDRSAGPSRPRTLKLSGSACRRSGKRSAQRATRWLTATAALRRPHTMRSMRSSIRTGGVRWAAALAVECASVSCGSPTLYVGLDWWALSTRGGHLCPEHVAELWVLTWKLQAGGVRGWRGAPLFLSGDGSCQGLSRTSSPCFSVLHLTTPAGGPRWRRHFPGGSHGR